MKKLSFGLRQKVIILCTLLALVLCGSVGYIGFINYSSNVTQKYKDHASALINIIEKKFNEYGILSLLETGEMDENYDAVRHELNLLKESANVDYIYSLYFPEEGNIGSLSYVINGATSQQLEEAASESEVYSYLGELCGEDDFSQEMKEEFLSCIQNKNTNINYYVNTTSEYGYQLTCYRALFSDDGHSLIIGVDISMNDINSNRIQYIEKVVALSLILLVIFLTIFISIINRYVVKPIMGMEESSRNFVEQTKTIQSPEELNFRKVPPCSRDEIEILRRSIEDMASGIKNYMIDLQRVTEEKGRITAELDVATNIQLSMLPRIFPAFPERKEFDIYATINTAKEVGGDFYDFYMIDDDHLCVTIADVSGKGVPAALFMVIAKTLLKDHMLLGKTPAQAFTDVNNLLSEENEENMFVTAWLAVIEISTLKATVVNAGHNPALIRKAGSGYEYYHTRPGMVLAGMPGMKYRQAELQLNEGDILYLYTDGITEANNIREELYGEERLQTSLNSCPTEDPKGILEKVSADIDVFVGEAPQFDDMTMVVLKINRR